MYSRQSRLFGRLHIDNTSGLEAFARVTDTGYLNSIAAILLAIKQHTFVVPISSAAMYSNFATVRLSFFPYPSHVRLPVFRGVAVSTGRTSTITRPGNRKSIRPIYRSRAGVVFQTPPNDPKRQTGPFPAIGHRPRCPSVGSSGDCRRTAAFTRAINEGCRSSIAISACACLGASLPITIFKFLKRSNPSGRSPHLRRRPSSTLSFAKPPPESSLGWQHD